VNTIGKAASAFIGLTLLALGWGYAVTTANKAKAAISGVVGGARGAGPTKPGFRIAGQ
jgi:hypothetical protein